jgi:hypothetical protein
MRRAVEQAIVLLTIFLGGDLAIATPITANAHEHYQRLTYPMFIHTFFHCKCEWDRG